MVRIRVKPRIQFRGYTVDQVNGLHLIDLGPYNGRFLRHRPERSEQCLNYRKLYQGQPASPRLEGVPKA